MIEESKFRLKLSWVRTDDYPKGTETWTGYSGDLTAGMVSLVDGDWLSVYMDDGGRIRVAEHKDMEVARRVVEQASDTGGITLVHKRVTQ